MGVKTERTEEEKKNTAEVDEEGLETLLDQDVRARPYRIQPHYKHFNKGEEWSSIFLQTMVGSEDTEGTKTHNEMVDALIGDIQKLYTKLKDLKDRGDLLTYGSFYTDSYFRNFEEDSAFNSEIVNLRHMKNLLQQGPKKFSSKYFRTNIEDGSGKISVGIRRLNSEAEPIENSKIYTLGIDGWFSTKLRPQKVEVYRELLEDALYIHRQLKSEGYTPDYSEGFAEVIID